MTHFELKPKGVCPKQISFDLDGNILHNVKFTGGCPGNLQALSRVVDGMTVEQLDQMFNGIDCAGKGTSCSDQLARLVRQAYETQKA